MADEKLISRRELLGKTIALGAVAAGAGVLLSACGSEESGPNCTDVSGLNAAQQATRTNLNYVEHSTMQGKNCANCSLFTAGAANACGTCSAVPGPINPGGHCNAWAGQTT